jgi:hypothetical protein
VNGIGLVLVTIALNSPSGHFTARAMLRAIPILCLLIAAAGAHARERQINPVPFAHSPCSVLDNTPCTPSYCSVFNHGPCIPEIDYPYGENLQVTVQSVPSESDAAKYRKPEHDLDSIGDLFAALRACWSPPSPDIAWQGMQMSVRFSFKRDGELVAPPRLTFATHGASADTRAVYLKAIDASLDACLPLKFTSGLGGALAGRPIAIRYIDNRDLKQTSSDK